MKTPLKVALGIATLWPLVYLFIFIGVAIYMISTDMGHSKDGPPAAFIAIFILHGITILWIFGLLAIYIYDLFHNDRVASDKKALWAVVLFFGNMIAMPVYWYLYVWREAGKPSLPKDSS